MLIFFNRFPFIFLAFLLNFRIRHFPVLLYSPAILVARFCTDWAITSRIERVWIKSILERKVKTRALKGIFLIRKWINNTFKSNSVRYHMHHRKNLSFLSSFGLRAVFVKGSKIAVFVSIVTSKRARWPPLFITFFIIFLTCYISVPSSIYNLCFFYFHRNTSRILAGHNLLLH